MNCVFLMNRNFERVIPGESRSCCNLEPTLSLSSLCRLSTIRCRPATCSTPYNAIQLIIHSSFHVSTRESKSFKFKKAFEPGSYSSLLSCVWRQKGSSWQLRLHDFNDAARGPCASREYAATTVKTANHHPPMATFWWGPQSIWLFIDNKINSERGQQTKWTFLALPYRSFESLFVTLLYCVDFE